MPRPLPVITATLPSRFMVRTLGELDLDMLAAGNVSRLAVDRVRDRIVCIREEHAAIDAGSGQGGDAHLVGETARVAATSVLGRRVHRSDPDDAPDRGGMPDDAHRPASLDTQLSF